MVNPTTHLKYRADIDGLRAISVLAVVIFHAFPNLLPGGFVGVDVFFVISGFLISSILFEQFSKRHFTYADFYSRRAKRILPALLLVFAFTIGFGWLFLLPGEYQLLGKHLISSAFFVQNFVLIKETGYFDLASDLKPLLHLWSLAVEEQFYIVWPILITLCRNFKIPFDLAIFFVAITSFGMNVFRVQDYHASTFFGPHSRFWELMIGAFLASRPIKQFSFSVLFGLLAIVWAFFELDGEIAYPGWYALIPTFGAALIIGSTRPSFIKKLLSNPTLVWIGLISYPLYLWHWTLLSFSRILWADAYLNTSKGAVIKLTSLILAIGLSYATYEFLEKPLRKSRLRYVPVLLCAGLITAGFIGFIIEKNDGFETRIKSVQGESFDPLTQENTAKVDLDNCLENFKFKSIQWCKTNSATSSPDVVIIGDSHGLSYSKEIARYYQNQGRKIHVFGTGDTLGLYDAGTLIKGEFATNGMRNLNEVFHWAIQNNAKTVLLVSRGPVYLKAVYSRTLRIRDLENLQITNPESVYSQVLEKTFQLLEKAHIETIFFFDNPDLGFYPKNYCLQRPTAQLIKPLSPCGIPYEKVELWQDSYRTLVASALKNHPKVKIFDPIPYLCDTNFCFAKKDNLFYYDDPHHLSSKAVSILEKHFSF